jgi:hypothetical protein
MIRANRIRRLMIVRNIQASAEEPSNTGAKQKSLVVLALEDFALLAVPVPVELLSGIAHTLTSN